MRTKEENIILELGELKRENIKLKAINKELVEALERAIYCEEKNGTLSIPCLAEMKEALKNAKEN